MPLYVRHEEEDMPTFYIAADKGILVPLTMIQPVEVAPLKAIQGTN